MHEEVLTMIKKVQQSLRRLDEIALKPSQSSQVGYLEILIESEQREAKSGWKQRVKYLEVAKGHAETLSKVKDEKESQNLIKKLSRDVDVQEDEKTRDAMEKLSLSGDKWYHRFKFWLSLRATIYIRRLFSSVVIYVQVGNRDSSFM